jgi:DnaJ family protein C protein 8
MSEVKKAEGLTAAQTKATMKIFASIEAKRRDVERRKRKFEQREREQEDEEKEKEKNERDHDKKWRETGRVEKRVGNWRDFQKRNG